MAASLIDARVKTALPGGALRVLDFAGAQAAASWVDVTSTGSPAIADAPQYGIDSTNALQLSQNAADATYLARYRYFNSAGWDCSKSDTWVLAFEYPPGHLPSRHRVGSSGTLELTISSDGDGVFTNNRLITLGGAALTGLPEMGRNVWTWNTSDMTPGGTINMANIRNIRLRLNTASATDTMILQGLWCGRRGLPAVMVTFDDGWAAQGLGASEAATLANAQRIFLTHYVIPDLIDTSDGSTYLSASELDALHAAGNVIAVHGTGPAGVGALIDYNDAGLAHVASQQRWVRERGYSGWQHFAYPGGAFNATVLDVMRSLGMKTARTLAGISYSAGPPVQFASRGSNYQVSHQVNGPPDWLRLNACPLNNVLTLAQVQAQIATTVKKGESIILYGHKLGAVADSLTFTTADFTALVAWLRANSDAGLFDIMTIPEFFDAFGARSRPLAASRSA